MSTLFALSRSTSQTGFKFKIVKGFALIRWRFYNFLRCPHKELCILGYPKCAQWRFWSDCAIWIFAWRTYPKVHFLELRLDSSCACAQSDPGFYLPLIYPRVFRDSVRYRQLPCSDFANYCGLRCPHISDEILRCPHISGEWFAVCIFPENVSLSACFRKNVSLSAYFRRNISLSAYFLRNISLSAYFLRNTSLSAYFRRNISLSAYFRRNVSPGKCFIWGMDR